MSRIDYVQQILAEVAAATGISGLALDEHSCGETRVHGLWLTLMHSTEPGEMLWLYVDLGPVPDAPERLCALMEQGYATWVQGEMTLAIDPGGKRLVGYSVIPVELLDAGRFSDTLERLLRAGRTVERSLYGPEVPPSSLST